MGLDVNCGYEINNFSFFGSFYSLFLLLILVWHWRIGRGMLRDGDLVLPTGGWNGWSLRIYDLATVLTKGECVVWADMGKWEVERYTESKQCTIFYL